MMGEGVAEGDGSRIPPQALDAERAVLGAMLLEHEAIGTAIELLEDAVFYRVAHRKILRVIIELFNKSEAADLVTVTEELKRGRSSRPSAASPT